MKHISNTMIKYPGLVAILLLANACSDTAIQQLQAHKTRINYAGVELRLPAILHEYDADGYNYRSKDNIFSMNVFIADTGYTNARQRFLASDNISLWKKWTTDFFDLELLREQNRFDNYQTIYAATKHGEDGLRFVSFAIDTKDDQVHKKLAAIANAALDTLVFSDTPTDRGTGLAYSVDNIEQLQIDFRMANIIGYKKNNAMLSVSKLDNAFLKQQDEQRDYGPTQAEGKPCEAAKLEQRDKVIIAGQASIREQYSQQCEDIKLIRYEARIPYRDKYYFTVGTSIVEDKNTVSEDNTATVEFFNEFLAKMSIAGH